MQDLIKAAIEKGKAIHDDIKRQMELEEQERIKKEKALKDAKIPLAMQWITEELPALVTKAISENPDQVSLLLHDVNYKNKFLEKDLISTCCIQLGLHVDISSYQCRMYDEGPLEDFLQYKLRLK